MEYPELKREVRAQYERFRPNVVLIEDKATQLIQELIREGLYAVTRYQPQSGRLDRADARLVQARRRPHLQRGDLRTLPAVRREELRRGQAPGSHGRRRAPRGVSRVQLFSGIHRAVAANDTVDMTESDAAPLPRAGWERVD